MFAAIRHRRPAPRPAEVGLAALLDQGPSKARRPINARSETAATSGMFKDALARRRCLVPADAFYEWKVVEGGKPLRDRGPALPVRLQPGPGATRLIVGQPPGSTFPVSRSRALIATFTIAARLMIAPAVAETPIDLSADPPKAKVDAGPSVSLGRVGPCPGCRTEPQNGSYNFVTPKGPRPIEPVPGILLSIPLGKPAR